MRTLAFGTTHDLQSGVKLRQWNCFSCSFAFLFGFFPLCRWFDALRQLAKGSSFLAGRGDRDPTRLALGLRGRPCEPPRQRRGSMDWLRLTKVRGHVFGDICCSCENEPSWLGCNDFEVQVIDI